MMKYKLLWNLTVLVSLSGCCVISPWSAWNYETKTDFSGHPSARNLPDPEQFERFYVDGAFIYARIIPHNQTNIRGDAPFLITINSTTDNPSHKGITFNSIELKSSLNVDHLPSPISVNRTLEVTEYLEFPVTKEFTSYSDSFVNPVPGTEGISTASLWTDDNLNFSPDDNEIINILIDVEVYGSSSSYRRTVEYEIFPRKESGLFQCIAV